VYSVNLPVKPEPVIAISWPDADPPGAQLDFQDAEAIDARADTATSSGARQSDNE